MLGRSIAPINLLPNELKTLFTYLSFKAIKAGGIENIFNPGAGRLFFCEQASSEKEKALVEEINKIIFQNSRQEDTFFKFLNKLLQEAWPVDLNIDGIKNLRELLESKILNQLTNCLQFTAMTTNLSTEKKRDFKNQLFTSFCFAIISHQQKRLETIPELHDKLSCLSKIAVFQNSASTALQSLTFKITINFNSQLSLAFSSPIKKPKAIRHIIQRAFDASRNEDFYSLLPDTESMLWNLLIEHLNSLNHIEPKQKIKILKALKKEQKEETVETIQTAINSLSKTVKKPKSQMKISLQSNQSSSSSMKQKKKANSSRFFRDVPRLEQLSNRSRSHSDPGTPTPSSHSSYCSE